MKSGPRYHVKPRRHRERKTDYRLRLKLLRSKKPRIVVRKSLKAIRVQFVEYNPQGDKILASAVSNELSKKLWLEILCFKHTGSVSYWCSCWKEGKRKRNRTRCFRYWFISSHGWQHTVCFIERSAGRWD